MKIAECAYEEAAFGALAEKINTSKAVAYRLMLARLLKIQIIGL